MKFAHNPIKDIIDLQNKLCEQLDIAKREVPSDNINEDLKERHNKLRTRNPIEENFSFDFWKF